jgi:hypothetical protein
MIIDRTKLEWPRWPKGGYVWREREWENEFGSNTGSYLVIPAWWEPKGRDDEGLPMPDAPYSYRPMENKFLLKNFANTEPTKEGIMSFVEKFGHLGIDGPHGDEIESTWADEIQPSWVGQGESLRHWIMEINLVRGALAEWALVGREEKFDEDDVDTVSQNVQNFWWLMMSEDEMDQLNRFEDGSFTFADPHNAKIGRLTELSNLINKQLSNVIQPVTKINENADGISFALAPWSLLGAIWVQIAEIVSPTSRWKMCGYCGELFEAKSLKAQYCKQSHQQMAHRKRKAKAETS